MNGVEKILHHVHNEINATVLSFSESITFLPSVQIMETTAYTLLTYIYFFSLLEHVLSASQSSCIE
jgi:hypothetical protein